MSNRFSSVFALLTSLVLLLFLASPATASTEYDMIKDGDSYRLIPVDQSGSDRQTRIIGGTNATLGEFPWIASINRSTVWRVLVGNNFYNATLEGHICGATLIDSRWLVTAAHCVDEPDAPTQVNVGGRTESVRSAQLLSDQFKVQFNSLAANGTSGEVIEVDQIISHPQHRIPNGDPKNDVALLHLKSASRQPAIDLMPDEFNSLLTVGSDLTLAGWGQIDNNRTRGIDALRKVTIQTIGLNECRGRFTDGGFIDESIICGLGTRRGACQGDSGGPMLFSMNNRYYQVGASSFVGNNNCGGSPSAYTRVSKFRRWIEENSGTLSAPIVLSASSTQDTTPLISWTQAYAARNYEIRIRQGSQQVFTQSGIVSASFTIPTALRSGTYQIDVRARDGNRVGNWGPLKSLTVQAQQASRPATPRIINTESTMQTTRPQFRWNSVAGATSYQIWLRNDTTGRTIENRRTLTSTSFTPSAALALGTHRFYVRAVNGAGSSNWSSMYRFTLTNSTHLIKPVVSNREVSMANRRPVISWSAVSNASHYYVWLKNETTNTLVANNVTVRGTNYQPPANLADGEHRFYVSARNFWASSGWSNDYRFTVQNGSVAGPPGIPRIASSFYSTQSRRPTISWSAVPGATRYQVWMQNVLTNKTVDAHLRVSGTNYRPSSDISYGSYRFYVRALNANGSSSWSSRFMFSLVSGTVIGAEEGIIEALAIDDADQDGLSDAEDCDPNDPTVSCEVLSCENRVASDYDGDGISDQVVYRPSTGTYFVQQSSEGPKSLVWGDSNFTPIQGDFDGDGKTDLGLVTSFGSPYLYWYIIHSSTGELYHRIWGFATDKTAIADYNGNCRDELAVYRDGNWHILNERDEVKTIAWGLAGDIPVPADYDGDGKADAAVWRPSTGVWWMLHSGFANAGTISEHSSKQWGLPGDMPMAANWNNADNKAELAIWRPSNGIWYVYNQSTGESEIKQWGLPGDQPRVGDFDGNGVLDFTVYRNSVGGWFHNNRDSRLSFTQWGLSGDVLPR